MAEQRRYQVTKAKIISGTVGSLFTAFAVHPLEVVKVRTQAQRVPVVSLPSSNLRCNSAILTNGLGDSLLPKNFLSSLEAVSSARSESPRGLQRRTFGTLRHIFYKEGVGSLYAGLGPTLTMGVPNTILYFLTYDELSRQMSKHNVEHQWAPAVAGASARSIASLSTAPLELVRTIQASRSGASARSRGMLSEFQTIIRREGVPGLYRGLAPSLLRDIPFSSIYWMSIEYCRTAWRDHDTQRHRVGGLTTVEHAGRALFNGTISGLIAAACTTPLDVIKTNQQLQVDVMPSSPAVLSDGNGASTIARRATSIDITKRILAEEGIQGFWRGNAARMTKVAPACACMIASYEVGQKLYLSEL